MKPTRLLSYLLSLLLLTLLACAEEPQPDAQFYYEYTPRLMARADLEAGVRVLPGRALRAAGKIYVQGRYLFINEPYEGIHIIDNQNPAAPRPLGFLRIPGNVDLAVQGQMLYADSGSDLLTFDLQNPAAATLRSRARDAFRELPIPDGGALAEAGYPANRPAGQLVVGWNAHKVALMQQPPRGWWGRNPGVVMFNARDAAAAAPGGGPGKGGSLARFAVVGEQLYTVDEQSLGYFDLRDPAAPVAGPRVLSLRGVETIFPQGQHLFLGTRNGMYIFDISQPRAPRQIGFYAHFTSCDPVVVAGRYAYVTLRTGGPCGGGPNQLQVIDLKDLTQPVLAKSYAMLGPRGLGVDGQQLFVCDRDGLRVFDTSQTPGLTQRQFFPVPVFDVIPNDGVLLAIGAAGLYQYRYTGTKLEQLSLLPVVAPR